MHRGGGCVGAALLSVALLSGSVARAQTSAPKKIAVLDVRAVGTFDPKQVAGLSTLIASEATRRGLRVISGADIATLLGFERQRQLMGCGESSCLVELGGALGVGQVVSSAGSEVGGTWRRTLTLLETARGLAMTRVTRQTERQKDLVKLVSQQLGEALQPIVGAPLEAAAAAAPPAETVTASTGTNLRPLGIGLDALALALAGAGGACHFLSLQDWDRARKLRDEGVDYDGFVRAKADSDAKMIGAGVLYGAGAVALGLGLYFTVAGQPGAPAVTVAPLAEGGGVVLAKGSF